LGGDSTTADSTVAHIQQMSWRPHAHFRPPLLLPLAFPLLSLQLDGQWQDCNQGHRKLHVTQVGKHTFTAKADSNTAGAASASWTFTVGESFWQARD